MAGETPTPILSVTWTDAETAHQGFLVVDQLVNGLAAGGIRLQADVTLGEVSALARVMSCKHRLLEIAVGGCKMGLACDPRDPDAVPVLTNFMAAVRPLLESHIIVGPDMGTTVPMLADVCAQIGMVSPAQAALDRAEDPAECAKRCVQGLSLRVAGKALADVAGGYGVAAAVEAALRWRGAPVVGARASVQGFGAMGGAAATCLEQRGIRVVAVADRRGTLADPRGLDVASLLRARDRFGEVDRGQLPHRVRQLPPEAWIETEADVLVPAATAGVINKRNCDSVRAGTVVEAANLPVTPAAEVWLRRRGVEIIPDVLASSGTTAYHLWLLLGMVEPTAAAILGKLSETMSRTVPELLATAARERRSPRSIAARVAFPNLDGLRPATLVARPQATTLANISIRST